MENDTLFHLEKPFEPKGDQPSAIEQLVEGIREVPGSFRRNRHRENLHHFECHTTSREADFDFLAQ